MRLLAALCLSLWSFAAFGAVDVTLEETRQTEAAGEQRLITKVTFGNEIASYTLVYDRNIRPDRPQEASSHWWGWTAGFIPIGMTAPSMANWYWQAFFNWRFDEEDLSKRPAEARVVRTGPDGVVEFRWDTPKVQASVFFALPTGSDKLLMFGRYTPKQPVQQSILTLVCYPTGFEPPHNRAITTALGTRQDGSLVTFDLTRERWILYEDVTPQRKGNGPAGLLIGTPEAFQSVTAPAGGYGITTTLRLKPEARSFALGLYDFPALPDLEETRDYFRRTADAEAAAIGRMAEAGLGQPLPALPVETSRASRLQAERERLFSRPAERWRPIVGEAFPWIGKQPGGPIRLALFVPRWQAWETMILAGSMQLEVRHLYFDSAYALTHLDYWPYFGTTGIGPLPYGTAMQRAVQMAEDPSRELFFVARVQGAAMPRAAQDALLKQVALGKGLVLVATEGWPAALFQKRNESLTKRILTGLAWEQIPGFREGDRGRSNKPLVEAFEYGQGRVIVLNIRPATYGALVPAHDEIYWRQNVMDTAMALAARAVQAAANRLSPTELRIEDKTNERIEIRVTPAPAGAKAFVRLMSDEDEHLESWGEDRWIPLHNGVGQLSVSRPRNRWHLICVKAVNTAGETVAYGSALTTPHAQAPEFQSVSFEPLAPAPAEALTPKINLPRGGMLTAHVTIRRAPPQAALSGTIEDAFGRRIAAAGPVAVREGQATLRLRLTRPVTVCHILRLDLRQGPRLITTEKRRFTIALPYPYDDFTGLMWSYAGGDPVLRRTDRLCYMWGAEMMDLCHMGGYEGPKAAREYWLSAESGLRLVPYVTRIAGVGNERHEREPCLHDKEYLEKTNAALIKTCAQAQAFSPAAYTLGDENYLFEGKEVCHRAESVAAFRAWLRKKYQMIEALNAAWGLPTATQPAYKAFEEIRRPMLLEEAAQQQISFAPWLDHKLFMAEAFAATHDLFRETIRRVDPQAKVGYDGFLGFTWQSGYDFERLAQRLELNQVYTVNWLQGELVRAFKRSDALTGKWGNSDADVEAGWHAFPWHCLLDDDNSVWWWTSFGCDYIPFNPDLSQSLFGQWFFESLREATHGPGKLLLHAERLVSPIAVYHSQTDFYLTEVAYAMGLRAPFAGGGQYLDEETAMLHGVRDAGFQYTHLTPRRLTPEFLDPQRFKIIFMPYPSCLSEEQAARLRDYVMAGGTLVVDGRAGMLTAEGRLRESRVFDELLGIETPAGLAAFKATGASGKGFIEGTLEGTAQAIPLRIADFETTALEPGVRVTSGMALGRIGATPLFIVNKWGRGRAVLLNFPLTSLEVERTKPGLQPTEEIIEALLKSAGLAPPAQITTANGERPLCLNTVAYQDGQLRYVAIMQDFRVRGLPIQKVRIRLPEAAFVYDIRGRRQLGGQKVQEWEAELGRGYPLVYALLPYAVKALQPTVAKTARIGEEIAVGVTVQATQPAEFHVVRLDVYPPGASQPHRQYSQNIACPRGKGTAVIPLALNDPKGQWRLVWQDVATGIKAERMLTVK